MRASPLPASGRGWERGFAPHPPLSRLRYQPPVVPPQAGGQFLPACWKSEGNHRGLPLRSAHREVRPPSWWMRYPVEGKGSQRVSLGNALSDSATDSDNISQKPVIARASRATSLLE
jgi:hypothetical protein